MKKVFSLFLAVLTLIPLFVGCKTQGGEECTSEIIQETETVKEYYDIIKDGQSDYTIIRPDKLPETILLAVIDMRKYIGEKYGINLTIDTDWTKDNKENNTVTSDESVHEILIGETNRAETRQVMEDHAAVRGFVIKAINGKIVIWGSNEELTITAIKYFRRNIMTDSALSIESDYLYVFDIKGDNMPLDILTTNYSVIYASSDSDKVFNAALKLSRELDTLSGKTVTPTSDTKVKDKSGKEILVGLTDRDESIAAKRDLKYMDYTVRITENKVVILGGSPLATTNAVDHFLSALSKGDIPSLEAGAYEFTSNYHEMIKDSLAFNQESFVPNWSNDFTPAAWMLDFEEKLYAVTSPTGRMTVDAHRGDIQNYPENSLECILSAIMMGCDVIEIDIRLTKDNIMVLMHDATLKRTTDWNQKKGKNGLPSSDKIADWTYAQLCELRLLYNDKATDCKIPTLYEAALLFKGKAFIHFDCKIETIDKNSDVFLLADEIGVKESFFYYYGISTMRDWARYNKEDTAFSNYMLKMTEYLNRPNHVLRKRQYELIELYGDTPDGWKQQYANGKKMIFTNRIYNFCKYAAANEQPLVP